MKKNSDIKVLQLIDSLDIGGAERMSVNIANALDEHRIKSFLCATRNGGELELSLSDNIQRLVLNKKNTLDLIAIYRLVRFIRKNKINIIHAHSSSFFTAILCKPFTGVKIVHHIHDGEIHTKKKSFVLRQASSFFDYIITVNQELKEWAEKNLLTVPAKIIYLQNFAYLSCNDKDKELDLPGTDQTRIVSLANLRDPKNHLLLLESFKTIRSSFPQWHLLLVGKDNYDDYSDALKEYIEKYNLESNIHLLGARNDSADILCKSTIGVISSYAEGLPVALLEYGLAKLAVVSTDVGECRNVLGNGKYGKIVPSQEKEALAEGLSILIENQTKREKMAQLYHEYVLKNYSQKSVVKKLLKIYIGILDG